MIESPEAEWLKSQSPARLLRMVRARTNSRKWRLFNCGCCRRIWDLLPCDQSRQLIEVVERYVDGLVQKAALLRARNEACSGWRQSLVKPRVVLNHHAQQACAYAPEITGTTAAEAVQARGLALVLEEGASKQQAFQAREEESNAQCELLRDLFGNPFHPVSLEPSWLVWNGGTPVKMAQLIYEEWRFDELPFLADALEDAGCDNADVLSHCREPGPHARGCWVLDLLLGKG